MAAKYESCSGGEGGAVLKLLSWNIDGLDERDLTERVGYVCGLIMLKRPHVVYLQEVVDNSWGRLIVTKLGRLYTCFCPPTPPQHYYNAILVLNDDAMKVTGSGLQVLDFCSKMGRHLLQLSVQFSGVDLDVMTSHLESLRDYGGERVRQLKIAFQKMSELQKSDKASIFGGDLNIREAEVKKAKVPENVVDVWVACGSQKEHQYTWDVSENDNLNWPHANRPKTRYDRIYLCPGRNTVRPITFELVGKDKISPCDRFPSDHWGLWAEFQVKK